MSELPVQLNAKRDQLLALLSTIGRCVVAFSGGVDSAVLAKAAKEALGDDAVAVTGNSNSLAEGELAQARALADAIGIRLEVVATQEFSNPLYVANAPDRCFHCKNELYGQLAPIAQRLGATTIVNGANLDDFGDFRPGMRAATEHGVRSPLAECELTKSDIRQLAESWNLSVASKPATPCLSSRIAYGQHVTPERLKMIDGAEQVLRSLGVRELRVRYHEGDLARVEVPVEYLGSLCEPEIRAFVVSEFQKLGFKFVTFDLAGLRSGSFTQLVPVEEVKRFSSR